MSEVEKYQPNEGSNDVEKPASEQGDVHDGREFNERLGIWITPVSKEETEAFDRAMRPLTNRKVEGDVEVETEPKKDLKKQLAEEHEALNDAEDDERGNDHNKTYRRF